MPRPPRLSPDDVATALRGLPLWSGGPDGIERTVELDSFRAAVDAVVAIADVAEEMDHHPDIDLRWRTLRIAVVTHSAGGLTELDLELARRVDEILAEYTGPLDPEVAAKINALFDQARRRRGTRPDRA